jgi:cytochrome c oxidase cbb3-type subunit 3
LKPAEMAQVASYILTFQGTTPANPKVAEGDIWVDETSTETNLETTTKTTDSITENVNN